MKKAIVLVSTIILFAGLTFAQTPQTQDKSKPVAKTENTQKKDSKTGCDKSCKQMGMGKSGCCHDGSGKATSNNTSKDNPDKK